MRGYIGKNGNYYEADDPQNSDDISVDLRPSDAYVLGQDAKWIIDRRQINNNNRTQRQMAERALGHREPEPREVERDRDRERDPREHRDRGGRRYPPPPNSYSPVDYDDSQYPSTEYTRARPAPAPAPQDDTKVVRNALFTFIAGNWLTLFSAAVTAGGMYATGLKTVYELNAVNAQQTEKIQALQEEHKTRALEQKAEREKTDLRISSMEQRYNDLSLLLQQIASKNNSSK